ncbi:FAD-dependent oxidoreductase [Symmachiella dynata]|uniref:FAD-dependent oxidoreductase n=1 Tax=Symmachiella dynata TaxID=2527995 RepID=UPI0030EDF02B
MQETLPAQNLVLIGAGHTNLHIVRMWREQPIPCVSVTLISAFNRATYSGMLPGTLAGLYEPREMEIDLDRLAAASGVRVVYEEAVGLDSAQQHVLLANRPPLRYDVAAIGIGSVPKIPDPLQQQPAVLSIKPMATFHHRLQERLAEVTQDGNETATVSVVIVGGGAAGVEVSFCLHEYLAQRLISAQLHLIERGETILGGSLPKTQQLAQEELQRRGIVPHLQQRVADFDGRQLILENGRSLAADIIITATTAAPPPVLSGFDLAKADDGFLATRPTLQSTSAENVFVVGDTATFPDAPVPKAGVYAVRQGPVLWENLKRSFQNQPLREFHPQSSFLSLLATGDGKAIGQYHGRAFHSRWAWKWKDYLDRKFMKLHQVDAPLPEKAANTDSLPPNEASKG